MYDIAVIGGDIRQLYIIRRLVACHFSVIFYGLCHPFIDGIGITAKTLEEAIHSSQILVSSIPFLKADDTIPSLGEYPDMNIASFLQNIESGQTLFAGMLSLQLKEKLIEQNVSFYDFMENDGVAILNGIATAEGAIMKAIEAGSGNLHGSQVLVTGFGRCGKILACKLSGLGCQVTVAARSFSDRCLAYAMGYQILPFESLPCEVEHFSYIFNTVPVRIFNNSLLNRLHPEVILIDIASKPGGVDFEKAKALSLNFHHLPGIPGKIAPKASADILVDFILQTNVLRKKVSL